MAKPKGTMNRFRQAKRINSKKMRAQRLRHSHLKKREISDPKEAEGNSLVADNSSLEKGITSCSAYGCTEQFKVGSNIRFFKFPRDEIRQNLWVRAVKQMTLTPLSKSVLCSKHFQTGRPSKNPDHPDYIPNLFVVGNSEEEHQNRSSTVQIEQSPYAIYNSSAIESIPIDSPSSSSFSEISGGGLKKDSDYPPAVPVSFAFANLVEGHSSPSQTEESQYVIYDKIEIEDSPIDLELSSSPHHIVESSQEEVSLLKCQLDQALKNICKLRKEKVDILKKLTILSAKHKIFENTENTGSKEDEVLLLKRKLNQALKNVCTLRKKLTSSSAQQKALEITVAEKERELQRARKEIKSLRSEKNAWQIYITDRITDRIFQDGSKLRFFTGLNSKKDFQSLTKLLPDVDITDTDVPVSTQLLIVLMRLQLLLKYPDLGDRFQTSIDTVRRICEIVIPHLESKLKSSLEELSPVTMGMQPNVMQSHTKTVFSNLYMTIQRYNVTKLHL